MAALQPILTMGWQTWRGLRTAAWWTHQWLSDLLRPILASSSVHLVLLMVAFIVYLTSNVSSDGMNVPLPLSRLRGTASNLSFHTIHRSRWRGLGIIHLLWS